MSRPDPNTPPIGRQPYAILIAPSRRYPWYGQIVGAHVVTGPTGPIAYAGGERFTNQQVDAVRKLGLDPTTIATMMVKRQALKDELWIPLGQLPPVFAFDCPVIGNWRGKVRVIAPDGQKSLVFPDGWGHRPIRIPRDPYGAPLC